MNLIQLHKHEKCLQIKEEASLGPVTTSLIDMNKVGMSVGRVVSVHGHVEVHLRRPKRQSQINRGEIHSQK